MNQSRLVLLFALLTGLLSGCQSVPANKPAVAIYEAPPTSLIITVEGEGMTEAEYKARRDELIAYLIERGYIQSEADLVADTESAGRIINATLVADGGFKLSVYNLDSQAVSNPTVVADYSVPEVIPASYYGDYYYYGFAPVPFYGYTSWPAYYPIYPTYPVCLPPRPVAPLCPPVGPYRHHSPFPKPAPYVYCTPQPKPVNNWAWHQPYPNWSNHNRYSRGNSDWQRRGSQPNGRPALATSPRNAEAASAVPNSRTPNRGNRFNNQSPSPRVASNGSIPASSTAVDTAPAATPARVSPQPGQRNAGQNVRPYNPERRSEGTANRPTVPNTNRNPGNVPNTARTSNPDQRPRQPSAYPRANTPENRNTENRNTAARPATPDNRPRQPSAYPRANNPENRGTENRNTANRPAAPDNRPRSYTPERTTAPRPTNVATNTRPTPAPRSDNTPRSAPAPRYDSNQNTNNSGSSSSSSNSRTTQSVRDSSSIRNPVER